MRPVPGTRSPRIAAQRATRQEAPSHRREKALERSAPGGESLMCERCGAVYERKTWRAGARERAGRVGGFAPTLCLACTQIEEGEFFGRVRVLGPLAPELEDAVRRRIWNVERRARHTQPERRTVRVDTAARGLEILTTSQKLAHRMARELEKAFGGRARYTWSDREGSIVATWTPPAART